jgi:hypothetical protein
MRTLVVFINMETRWKLSKSKFTHYAGFQPY